MKLDHTTVAVITGAGSGIGRAVALRVAREGAPVAIADVNQAGLDETSRLLADQGDKHSVHLVDVSDNECVAAFAQEVVREHGRANLVVNNAGVALAGTAEELSIADIEWLMGINFWGVIYGVKHFLPILRQQPRGHFVNISSVFGIVAPPGQSAYAASKFAVRGFTESLRHELAGSSISVSTVHPGGIKTNIANSAKIGAGAQPSSAERERELFNKVARTSPDAAAERIVRGILRDEERILIGADAHIIERIQRWTPVKYWSLLDRMIKLGTKE